MDMKKELVRLAKSAQEASRLMALMPATMKNIVLKDMAGALIKEKNSIKRANQKDLILASKLGLSGAFIERLRLNDEIIQAMSDSFQELIKLPDPVGEVIKVWDRPNGLKIKKVRVPIGVIAIIYESRPNVTAECIGLCFKSGNSVILRGGSEALNSNLAIYKILKKSLKKFRLPEAAVNFIRAANRGAIDILLRLNDFIDLVIPRGGEGLIRKVAGISRIPVIKHYKGVCHIYVDKKADLDMAKKVCFNAKVQRPGVCNAMESMLVHKSIAASFLPEMIKEFAASGVEIRGCLKTQKIAKDFLIKLASEKDYRSEYLDLILSVKVVENLEEAVKHINTYGTHHSDSIITEDNSSSREFLRGVDSACVYLNASTRFTDGYQFGLGAEIGISTDKIHARGPMGLEELTTYKYQIYGKGQIRS